MSPHDNTKNYYKRGDICLYVMIDLFCTIKASFYEEVFWSDQFHEYRAIKAMLFFRNRIDNLGKVPFEWIMRPPLHRRAYPAEEKV